MMSVKLKVSGISADENAQSFPSNLTDKFLAKRIKKIVNSRRIGLKRTLEINVGNIIKNSVADECPSEYVGDMIRDMHVKKNVGAGDMGYDAKINSSGNMKFTIAFSKTMFKRGGYNPYWFIMNSNYGKGARTAGKNMFFPTVVFNSSEASHRKGDPLIWEHPTIGGYYSPSGKTAYVRFSKTSSAIPARHWIETGIDTAKEALLIMTDSWADGAVKNKGAKEKDFIQKFR